MHRPDFIVHPIVGAVRVADLIAYREGGLRPKMPQPEIVHDTMPAFLAHQRLDAQNVGRV